MTAQDMIALYHESSQACSRLITNKYSTSFSLGICMFARRFRAPIYAIYGFVRLADEIVDSFHGYDKASLLNRFRRDTWRAIEEGISLNPILHSFQQTVNHYGIQRELIEAFLDSMEMDLHHNRYSPALYKKYIYGSAEVVGLMCLRVFCEGDEALYQELEAPAKSLGAAFQKVNFLRDLRSDFDERGRVYFPGVNFENLTAEDKATIEADILQDFDHAYAGILKLPVGARLGVYVAYVYYLELFRKIQRSAVETIRHQRIRVSNGKKIYLLCVSAARSKLNLI